MPTKDKPVRQSVSLPARVARRVRSIARARRISASRAVVDLVESGLAARERDRRRFLDLAERLAESKDRSEQRLIKRELERLTFGS